MNYCLIVIFLSCILHRSACTLYDFERLGAIPNNCSYEISLKNGQLMNYTLSLLQSGDIFFVSNKTFSLIGGIQGSGFSNVVIKIDGTVSLYFAIFTVLPEMRSFIPNLYLSSLMLVVIQ